MMSMHLRLASSLAVILSYFDPVNASRFKNLVKPGGCLGKVASKCCSSKAAVSTTGSTQESSTITTITEPLLGVTEIQCDDNNIPEGSQAATNNNDEVAIDDNFSDVNSLVTGFGTPFPSRMVSHEVEQNEDIIPSQPALASSTINHPVTIYETIESDEQSPLHSASPNLNVENPLVSEPETVEAIDIGENHDDVAIATNIMPIVTEDTVADYYANNNQLEGPGNSDSMSSSVNAPVTSLRTGPQVQSHRQYFAGVPYISESPIPQQLQYPPLPVPSTPEPQLRDINEIVTTSSSSSGAAVPVPRRANSLSVTVPPFNDALFRNLLQHNNNDNNSHPNSMPLYAPRMRSSQLYHSTPQAQGHGPIRRANTMPAASYPGSYVSGTGAITGCSARSRPDGEELLNGPVTVVKATEMRSALLPVNSAPKSSQSQQSQRNTATVANLSNSGNSLISSSSSLKTSTQSQNASSSSSGRSLTLAAPVQGQRQPHLISLSAGSWNKDGRGLRSKDIVTAKKNNSQPRWK